MVINIELYVTKNVNVIKIYYIPNYCYASPYFFFILGGFDFFHS